MGPTTGPSGVVVFIKPYDTGTFPENWGGAFDSHNLIWISADDFGNRTPTAKRILTAIMAVALAGKVANVDASASMSPACPAAGASRARRSRVTRNSSWARSASWARTYFMPEEPLRSRALERRFVFITGGHDFNRNEMRHVFSQLRQGRRHATSNYSTCRTWGTSTRPARTSDWRSISSTPLADARPLRQRALHEQRDDDHREARESSPTSRAACWA